MLLQLECGDKISTSESDVFRRQILTTKVYPRAVSLNTRITNNVLDDNLPYSIDTWGIDNKISPWKKDVAAILLIF